MSREKYISVAEFIIVYIAFGVVLLFQYSRVFTENELFLFAELIMAYVWISGLLVYAKIRFDLNIFEPISMITVIYEGIFIIKPLIDLRNNTMSEHGISVIGGGAKATLLFVIGYTVFYFSYYTEHRFSLRRETNEGEHHEYKNLLKDNRFPWIYVGWLIVYALCIYCMFTQGLSLRYIFSFGTDGVRVRDESNTALLFLSNFGITLISLWLMILEYSKNIAMKIITTSLCIIYILMRNARWLMFVFILAPITLAYLKKKRQPRLLLVVLVAVVGLFIFAWMQSNRATLAAGGAMQGWGVEGFSLETLVSPLESDLSTYRTFYNMVERYPARYDFLYGVTFLYTFVLFIPRALWPGKPDNPVRDVIEHSLNKSARASGTAVANIGEFYANFGAVGIVCFMYLIGWIAVTIKEHIFLSGENGKKNMNRYMAYSIFFPLLFQWIARGNFSGNIYMTLFAMLPFLLVKMLKRQKSGVET